MAGNRTLRRFRGPILGTGQTAEFIPQLDPFADYRAERILA